MRNRLFQRVALSFIAYSERRELSMLPRSNVAAPFVSIVHSSSHFPVMISWIRSISFAGRLLPFLELFPLRVIIFQIIGGKLPFVSTSRFFKMDTCQCHVRSAESFQHAAPAKHLKRSSILFFQPLRPIERERSDYLYLLANLDLVSFSIRVKRPIAFREFASLP